MTSSFIATEKYIDVLTLSLRDYCNLLIFEGTIRSSKTENAKPIFMFNIFNSTEELHLIAAYDLDAINDNILNGEHGLLAMFPNHLSLQKDEIGGYYVHVKGRVPMTVPKDKKILLAGFARADKWKKILGKTIGIILIDETNTANKQFIDETFARQASADNPLQIWTLNGDVPQHWIYTDYINRARIFSKYRNQVPASIQADMSKSKKEKNWFYVHWNMTDNPIMDEVKIARTSAIYPVGSFYHTIKVLGERGAPGRLIYLDYLDSDLIQEVNLRDYPYCGIGVDIGATRARNAITLSGFKRDFTGGAYIAKRSFQQVGYEDKTKELIAFIKLWQARGANIEYVAVDSQEANYIRDLKAQFKQLGLPEVIPSYKATIKQRIDMNIILFATKRWLFNNTVDVKELYDSFSIAKWVEAKEGLEREDLNEPHIDDIDSAEYSQTPHMKRLLLNLKAHEIKLEEVA